MSTGPSTRNPEPGTRNRSVKIVVLDSFTLNPGDLSWAGFEAIGPCDIHLRSAPEERVARLRGAQIALTNKVKMDRATIEQCPDLKYIGVLATGFDIIDRTAAKERGISVTNVPVYGTNSVAQAVFALLLELTNQVGLHAQSVSEGGWTRCSDFCYTLTPQVELHGLKLGLVGYGKIGQAVGEIAAAFGMKVTVAARSTKPGVANASIDEIFRESDVVSLHCPLTPDTEKLVNAARLRSMKKSAFLINTSRGKLVDEAALADALNSGVIAGAGLDVLSVEPPPADNPLPKAKNCIITPHIAWASHAARQRLMNVAVDNLKAFLSGKPQNVVN
jgi:glycerate dehydrogenase